MKGALVMNWLPSIEQRPVSLARIPSAGDP